MFIFYTSKMITTILKKFNIKNIILLGQPPKEILEEILNNETEITAINHSNLKNINTIIGHPLICLPKLENYDAIFINDDANWYTLYNELNIIKKTNENFPLVFVCNNKFPNKRRDCYNDPKRIPIDFRQKYVKGLPIQYQNNELIIPDGCFHAIQENTDKNGVSTAIDDFLIENNHIGIMDINFVDEILVLYPKSQLNQKRINIIINNSDDIKLTNLDLTDKSAENKILLSYINEFNAKNPDLNKLKLENDKKDDIINEYENEIKLQVNEINFKKSQINNIESKLNLKDSQIKNLESKLVNDENKINNLQDQLDKTNNKFQKSKNELNSQIELLNKEIIKEKDNYNNRNSEYKSQITIANSQINFLKENIAKIETELETNIKNNNNTIDTKNLLIKQKDQQIKNDQQKIDTIQNQLNNNNEKLKEKQEIINNLEHNHIKQMAKIDNKEYCISCYKEEISNYNLEISYLKKNNLTKRIFAPLAYIFIILNSSPQDFSLNIMLYRLLKNNKCFNIGFYLNKNKDLIGSKWCKFFSPELHYVCKGFDEKRFFNKQKFNSNSKKELLECILKCNK